MSKDHDKASHGSQDARRHKLDHQLRNEWIDRDTGLQEAWKKSGMTRDDFIHHNESMIDQVISANVER